MQQSMKKPSAILRAGIAENSTTDLLSEGLLRRMAPRPASRRLAFGWLIALDLERRIALHGYSLSTSDQFIADALIESEYVLKGLSAVSGAPRHAGVQLHGLSEALRIQRLEGSRPRGSLCVLNEFERVQRDQKETQLDEVRWPGGRMEGRIGWPRGDAEAGEAGRGGVWAG